MSSILPVYSSTRRQVDGYLEEIFHTSSTGDDRLVATITNTRDGYLVNTHGLCALPVIWPDVTSAKSTLWPFLLEAYGE